MTAFVCDSRLLLAGIGPAGSGKTTAMRALEHATRAAGKRLVPLATSAASAAVLGRELGLRAENLHKFLHEWTAGPFAARLRAGSGVPEQACMFRLSPGDVVLVDEAGMAGTFPLDQIVRLAAARGAVVRLLGDDRQLPAVEGGGALRLVASQPGTPQLDVLYRFRDPAKAAATLQVRAGDPAAADWYAAVGRVRSGSREEMAEAAYDGWKTDMLAGKVTLMAAADNSGVAGLSARARADRVAAGQVEAGGVQLRDGNLAGQGDWIVTRDNQRRLGVFGGRDWVKNGDGWEVTRRHEDGSLRVRHLGHGGCVVLPAGYVGAHVQLLYATTAHRAQGATVDTAHPLVTEGMSREALYVLTTRARDRTTLYVATHDLPCDDDARVNRVRTDPVAQAAREVLLNILANASAPLSATETITTAQEESGSLSVLVPRYLHAARQDSEARYQVSAIDALGENRGRELARDPAWSAVVRRLHDAENDGWNPARLLATVASPREPTSADSTAEAIAWRINPFLAANPAGPPAGPTPDTTAPEPYETSASARTRLAAIAVTAIGEQAAARARSETAWPALLAALRRAEYAGFNPADALTCTATARELRTARSISEMLAWRISRHLVTHPPVPHPDEAGPDAASASGSPIAATATVMLLPWVPGPRVAPPDAGEPPPLATYIDDAAALITARITELADTAIRHRPPWVNQLGEQPADPSRASQWRGHVEVVAAYRDQHSIATDDPRQILGPYPEPGYGGYAAYWHAAESVLAARLTALDPATSTGSADTQASAQVAADIYHALSRAEQDAIATAVSQASGATWLGHPDQPDRHAAAQPCYATALTAELARRGHAVTRNAPTRAGRDIPEPVEATFARHRQPPAPRPAPGRMCEADRGKRSLQTARPPAPDVRTPHPRV